MKKLIIIAISITILNSCGTKKGITRFGTPIINIEQSLLKGEIRLECDVACSGSYGYIMKKLKRLYEGSLWLELVKEVVNNGHRSDESYFYLARSAEELGSIDAAYEYYKLAKYSTPCKSPTVNNCNGFSFPADIDYRLEKIRSIKDTDKKIKEINQEYNKENIKKEPEKPIEAPTQEINKQNSDIKNQVKLKKHSTDKKEATKKITEDHSKKTEESSTKENIEPQKTQDIKENQQSLDKKEPIKIKSFFDL
jgi:hypothetical protein